MQKLLERKQLPQHSALTFDTSILYTGSHSEQDLGELIVASRAGQRQEALTILCGILDSVAWGS